MFGTHIGSSNDLYIVVIITVKNKRAQIAMLKEWQANTSRHTISI